jgi:hypothetical protein
MPDRLIWWTNNRNPSITENITVDGAAFDLTSSTVKFKMRPVGGSTVIVDANATIVTAADGTVRYDWAAEDVDTAGTYLIWWDVTTSGKVQAVNEAVIEIRDHAPSENTYLELEEAKATLELSGYSYVDGDMMAALVAASRAIDNECGRRFYLDTDNTSVRYYTAESANLVLIDDIVDIQEVAVDNGGSGTFVALGTSAYKAGPWNALSDSRPYEFVKAQRAGQWFPCYDAAVRVTGQFGWTAVPGPVKECTAIYAARLLKRAREAPFGIQSVGIDGVAVRISRTDPDLMFLLNSYVRRTFAL